jgi:hypothetical protein
VRIRTTIRQWQSQLKRQWRALRARLRREGAAVGLLALLTLGLGEPLLCIIHCQIWLPSAYHSYFAAQNQHAHHDQHAHHGQHGLGARMSAAANEGSVVLTPSHASANDPSCLMPRAAGDHGGVPFHVPPSPIHDVLPVFLTLSIAMLVLHTRPAAPPGDPPQRVWPPPLRPPIPFVP